MVSSKKALIHRNQHRRRRQLPVVQHLKVHPALHLGQSSILGRLQLRSSASHLRGNLPHRRNRSRSTSRNHIHRHGNHPRRHPKPSQNRRREIGRASCRGRV